MEPNPITLTFQERKSIAGALRAIAQDETNLAGQRLEAYAALVAMLEHEIRSR